MTPDTRAKLKAAAEAEWVKCAKCDRYFMPPDRPLCDYCLLDTGGSCSRAVTITATTRRWGPQFYEEQDVVKALSALQARVGALARENAEWAERAVEWFSGKVDGLDILEKAEWRDALLSDRFPRTLEELRAALGPTA